MDFRSLLYFCTIVESGQIKKAAKRLNMSQPPLSLTLKKLEEELGTTLIFREKNAWELTKAGDHLYSRARIILSQLDGLQHDMENSKSDISGTVKIGIDSHCLSYFINAFPVILKQYPGISLRTIVADAPTIEDNMQKREIDLMLLRLQLNNDNYTIYKLPDQHFVAVYSPLLPPPPDKEILELEDVADYPLMLSRRWTDAGGFRAIIAAFQSKGLAPHIALDSQMPFLNLALLYSSPCIALMPNTEIPKEDRKIFPIRRLNHFVIFQPVIAYLSEIYLRAEAKAVIDVIRSVNSPEQ